MRTLAYLVVALVAMRWAAPAEADDWLHKLGERFGHATGDVVKGAVKGAQDLGGGLQSAGAKAVDDGGHAVDNLLNLGNNALQGAESRAMSALKTAETVAREAAPVVVAGLVVGAAVATVPVLLPLAATVAAGAAVVDFADGVRKGLGDALTGEGKSPTVSVTTTPPPAQSTSPGQSQGQSQGQPQEPHQTTGAAGASLPAESYHIQAGDTLGGIATKLAAQMQTPPPAPPVWGPGGLVDLLAKCNADTVADPHWIYTGNVLKIPSQNALEGDPSKACQ